MSAAPPWLVSTVVPRLAAELRAADERSASAPPPGGAGEGVRQAAVLLLFADIDIDTDTDTDIDTGPSAPQRAEILLTLRADHLRAHAGQVAFPGGRAEPGDPDPARTALREASEEVGLDASSVTVVAELPVLRVVPSNNDVTPVVAWWHRPGPLVPDRSEVSAVARTRLAQLADPAVRIGVRHPAGGVWPGFRLPELLVWGFTAWVLDRVVAACGLEVGWDRSPVLEMPPPASRPLRAG
ncbi:MAG: NUDIX hydrolase [Kineosporiaceae bacterium]